VNKAGKRAGFLVGYFGNLEALLS